MQITRHWRMNSQRYRLVGARYQNGQVRLQPRPVMLEEPSKETFVTLALPLADLAAKLPVEGVYSHPERK